MKRFPCHRCNGFTYPWASHPHDPFEWWCMMCGENTGTSPSPGYRPVRGIDAVIRASLIKAGPMDIPALLKYIGGGEHAKFLVYDRANQLRLQGAVDWKAGKLVWIGK